MTKLKFTRKANKIFDIEAAQQTTYQSVSKAKKMSRKLQMETDGGLGRGCLKVEK